MMSEYKYDFIDPYVFANTDESGRIVDVRLSSDSVMFYGKETTVLRGYEFHATGVCEGLKSMIDDFLFDKGYYVDLDRLCKIVAAITGNEFDEIKQHFKEGVDKAFQTEQPHVFKPVDEEE